MRCTSTPGREDDEDEGVADDATAWLASVTSICQILQTFHVRQRKKNMRSRLMNTGSTLVVELLNVVNMVHVT